MTGAREQPRAPATQPHERVAQPASAPPPLHLVLVEPQIPPNTGNVARLCAATGCALHLVEPLGFTLSDRELKRAGLDYWDALTITLHPSLEAFVAAWTAPLWLFSTRAARSYERAEFERGAALVFGKETAGLPQALLDRQPERVLRIPMRRDAVRSLNLATCVGIAAYAALARLGFPDLT